MSHSVEYFVTSVLPCKSHKLSKMLPRDNRTLCILAGSAIGAAAAVYVILGPSGAKKKRKAWCPPGLVNHGNSCFANALLQALAPCRSARRWLANFVQQKPCQGNTGLTTAMHTALQALNNEGEEDKDEYCASDVVTALKAQGWHISFDEQDAHELFHVLTETLSEEMQLHRKTLSLFEAYKIQEAPVRMCGKNRMDIAVPSHQQKQISPFTGTLTNQLQCQSCGHKNPVQHDYFDSLTLPIPSSFGKDVGLYQMLGNYMKRETVEKVECKACGPHSKFSKKLTIGRLPKCLCLHVQRTTWLNNGMPLKRHDHVHFPELLNMSAYVYQSLLVSKAGGDAARGLLGGQQQHEQEHPTQNVQLKSSAISSYSTPVNMLQALNTHGPVVVGKTHAPVYGDAIKSSSFATSDPQHNSHHLVASTTATTTTTATGTPSLAELAANQRHTYKLSAVVCHLGDAFSGHFVTYRRVPTPHDGGERFPQRWVYCSDTMVTPTTLQDVLAANAYMLFYDRVLL